MIVLLLNISIVSCVSTLAVHQELPLQVNIEDFIYCSFLGGNNEDYIRDVVTDSQGNFIVTGYTLSTNFPVKDSYQDSFAGGENDLHGVGGDAIVAKFDKDGQLLWSTYLGGSDIDGATCVNVVTGDNIVILGLTKSNDFPTTTDAYQQDYSANYDIFIAKFASNGTLIYSSYLGASGNDQVNDCELDSAGNFVIAGGTGSSTFPVTADANQSVFGGGSDGFLMRLSPNCSTILYSTFLGGSGYEGIDKFVIDAQGNIIVSGPAVNPNFPITEDAYQDSINGTHRDFFIAKYNPSGEVTYATYFGGSHMDDCFGVGVDSSGNIIASGRTWSADFPTVNAYQENYSDGVDGIVTKLSADGQELIFSSYFGGSAWDTIHHVSVDSSDNVLVSGGAGPDGFPIIDAFQENHSGSWDNIIILISPDGQPVFSSYLGGNASDMPWNQYLSNDHLYIVGSTKSSDFPVTSTAYQKTYIGNEDGYIFRFDIEGYLAALYPETTTTTAMTTIETTTESKSSPSFEIYLVFLGIFSVLVINHIKTRKRLNG